MTAATTQSATVARHPFFDFNDAADLILPRHDKNEIRTRLLDQLESVLLYLFPHGKRRGSQFYIGNLQGEPGDSLVVELEGPKRGVWLDISPPANRAMCWRCGPARGVTACPPISASCWWTRAIG